MSNFICQCDIVLRPFDPSCYSCGDKPKRKSIQSKHIIYDKLEQPTFCDKLKQLTFCDVFASLIILFIFIFQQLISVLIFLSNILSPIFFFLLHTIMTILMILGCSMILFVSIVIDTII